MENLEKEGNGQPVGLVSFGVFCSNECAKRGNLFVFISPVRVCRRLLKREMRAMISP